MSTPPRSSKRSRSMVLTAVMAGGAGLSLTACDQPATQGGFQRPPVEAQSYASLADCKTKAVITADQCDAAYAQAEKENAANAPRFGDQQSCEQRYGVSQCVPRNQAGGGSFFTPLLTGFIVGQALNNLGGGYRGVPMYRDRDGYVTGYGGRVSRDYLNGRTRIGSGGYGGYGAPSYQAPSRMQSRSSVISRGGFGGGFGGRGFGG